MEGENKIMVKRIRQKNVRYKKHNLLISAVLLSEYTSEYEVAVFDLDLNMKELEMKNVYTIKDCEFYFEKFLKKYTEVKKSKEETKIPKRYLKFAEDYNYIYQRCKNELSVDNIDDKNASNFDTCFVYIGKRIQKGFLNAALKPYNLKYHLDKDYIAVVVPYTQLQGSGNTLQVEYMYNLFIELGYESFVKYIID